MSIKVGKQKFDTMAEATERLEISRGSLLRYMENGFFTPSRVHVQGRGKPVKYFDAEWYSINEARLADARKKAK